MSDGGNYFSAPGIPIRLEQPALCLQGCQTEASLFLLSGRRHGAANMGNRKVPYRSSCYVRRWLECLCGAWEGELGARRLITDKGRYIRIWSIKNVKRRCFFITSINLLDKMEKHGNSFALTRLTLETHSSSFLLITYYCHKYPWRHPRAEG